MSSGRTSSRARCVARGVVIVASLSSTPRAGQQESVREWQRKQRAPIANNAVLITKIQRWHRPMRVKAAWVLLFYVLYRGGFNTHCPVLGKRRLDGMGVVGEKGI